jgi:uncharacterized FlaG/YvyC family protein
MSAEKYLKEKGYYFLPKCVPNLMDGYAQAENKLLAERNRILDIENKALTDTLEQANERETAYNIKIEQLRELLEKIEQRNYWINKELKFEIEKQLKSK